MSLFKRGADTLYVFRFLRILVRDWNKTKAYELGLIDDRGKKIKKPTTDKEKSAYTLFHRLVFNLKRLLEKLPGGLTRKLASYASALYLIKEHTGLDEKVLLEMIPIKFTLSEEKDTPLIEGRVYQLKNDIPIVINEHADATAPSGTKITVYDSIGEHFGKTLYNAFHHLTEKKIVVSSDDVGEDLNKEEFSVSTTDVAMPPAPLKTDRGDKYQTFMVPSSIFKNFDKGRKKYQRWKYFLDLNDEKQLQIAQFAKKHRDATVILQDETTGAMRSIRPMSSDGR